MRLCPECGSSRVETVGKRNWPYPVALVAVIGATLALLHQAASPIDYRCLACGLPIRAQDYRWPVRSVYPRPFSWWSILIMDIPIVAVFALMLSPLTSNHPMERIRQLPDRLSCPRQAIRASSE